MQTSILLKENGFGDKTVGKDGKTVTYRDDVKQLQVEVAIQSGGAMITTTYAPKQDKPTRPQRRCL